MSLNYLCNFVYVFQQDSIPLSVHPIFQEPDIQIDDVALDYWKRDQLEHAEAVLTAKITASQNTTQHLLASRALVRTRLRNWDAALVDAEMVLCCAALICANSDISLHIGYQVSPICLCLHRKEYISCRKGRNAQRLSDLRHHVRVLPFVLH